MVAAASSRVLRYGRSEIRILPTVGVAPLRQHVNEVARKRRELDAAIQAANWTTELLKEKLRRTSSNPRLGVDGERKHYRQRRSSGTCRGGA
jgi:hypothetical protein